QSTREKLRRAAGVSPRQRLFFSPARGVFGDHVNRPAAAPFRTCWAANETVGLLDLGPSSPPLAPSRGGAFSLSAWHNSQPFRHSQDFFASLAARLARNYAAMRVPSRS